jgi:3-hydroxyisobutyrate dehydrogenase-like beta-hydroxyacid dehydrogenase
LATRPWPGEEGRVFLNEVDDGSEAATVVKLRNNLVLGCAMIAMAEGFSLVRKYGVEPQVLYEVMTEGLFSAPAYKGYGKTMVEQKYEPPGSPITVGLNDANLIQAAADLARVPLSRPPARSSRSWRRRQGSSRASPRASPRLWVGIANPARQ